ncbi:unnamed protein product, partial [Brenthis ino]
MSGREEEDPKPPRIQSCSRLRYRSSQETRHPTTAATISLAQRTLKSVPIGPRDHRAPRSAVPAIFSRRSWRNTGRRHQRLTIQQ